MAVPVALAVGAGLSVGKAALDIYGGVSRANEAERMARMLRLQNVMQARSIRENERRNSLLRGVRLTALQGQQRVNAAALNVIGGASLAALNETLAHGASLEEAWAGMRAAETLAGLKFQQIDADAAAKTAKQQAYLGAAGSIVEAGMRAYSLTQAADEATGTLPLSAAQKQEADALTRGFR